MCAGEIWQLVNAGFKQGKQMTKRSNESKLSQVEELKEKVLAAMTQFSSLSLEKRIDLVDQLIKAVREEESKIWKKAIAQLPSYPKGH